MGNKRLKVGDWIRFLNGEEHQIKKIEFAPDGKTKWYIYGKKPYAFVFNDPKLLRFCSTYKIVTHEKTDLYKVLTGDKQ